ncbi:MAG: molybdate ABC transporter substrate-binding protein [Novosphingobium sp.]|nr:molybdate ABC transporter substrate-binding protein [Novosphingobium sp.]
MTLLRLLLLAVLMLGSALPASAAAARPPLVLAAASLQETLSAAADAWARHGHPRPAISFAASSALARQIEAGAPADVFVSADEEWMNDVAAKGFVAPGTRAPLVSNSLVLVAPAGSRIRLAIAPHFPLAQALGPGGRLAMADPDSVPAGKYGKQALVRLGVWPAIAARVVRAENVRAALAFVARGAAPLGIVYGTDARVEPAVRVVGVFPATSHAPIVYPLARLKTSANPEAEGFRRFLLSSEARAIFAHFGFGTG